MLRVLYDVQFPEFVAQACARHGTLRYLGIQQPSSKPADPADYSFDLLCTRNKDNRTCCAEEGECGDVQPTCCGSLRERPVGLRPATGLKQPFILQLWTIRDSSGSRYLVRAAFLWVALQAILSRCNNINSVHHNLALHLIATTAIR